MRIVNIHEKMVALSRYADHIDLPKELTTSVVAVVTDHPGADGPLIGYGFASIGRFAQSGLIRERFAPRLLAADPAALLDCAGRIEPSKAWQVMMRGEKPGGHGERCVAVGALDMALWDLAAKAAGQPLCELIARTCGRSPSLGPIPVYAGGGYYFPDDDLIRLRDEVGFFLDQGFRDVKIKIGAASIVEDMARIETALDLLGEGQRLAVDAMNAYGPKQAINVAKAIESYDLGWFEDICDPLDFETHKEVTAIYRPPISAGEALFSRPDTRNLLRYAGLRPGHDVLTFDPAHCYGLTEYMRLVDMVVAAGWSPADIQPHGGHLFSLQVAAGLGLGGCECNPHNFQPFGGFGDDQIIQDGAACPPAIPGIGFETDSALIDLMRRL